MSDMDINTCSDGHMYDGSIWQYCPYCHGWNRMIPEPWEVKLTQKGYAEVARKWMKKAGIEEKAK
ncbi:MAG: hypothetical protein ACR2PH_16505 [Desulfobulbia bacterium]